MLMHNRVTSHSDILCHGGEGGLVNETCTISQSGISVSVLMVPLVKIDVENDYRSIAKANQNESVEK